MGDRQLARESHEVNGKRTPKTTTAKSNTYSPVGGNRTPRIENIHRLRIQEGERTDFQIRAQ
jgi:hypothetical protein